jgi:hypothetical protein
LISSHCILSVLAALFVFSLLIIEQISLYTYVGSARSSLSRFHYMWVVQGPHDHLFLRLLVVIFLVLLVYLRGFGNTLSILIFILIPTNVLWSPSVLRVMKGINLIERNCEII